MTTYSLTGFGLNFSETDPGITSIEIGVNIDFVAEDGPANFFYTILNTDQEIPEVALSPNNLINIRIGETTLTSNNTSNELFIGFIDWNDNGVVRTTILADFFLTETDIDYWVAIGGDPFPQFSDVADFNNFLGNDVLDFGEIPSGPVAPGTNIPLTSLLNVTTTENDTIIGSDANEILDSGIGNDTINGNGGSDTIEAGSGNDTVIAGLSDGDDVLTGGSGFDILDFSAVQGVVQINQLGGVITGSAGNDTLLDVFEQIIGSNFDDVLSGGNGGDVLDGGGGNDQFFANGGDDLVRGGEDNDTIFHSTNDGNDRLEGGAGFDVLNYSSLQGVVQVNQLDGTTTGTANNDILLDVFEAVIGSNFGDVLSGGNGINVLNGGGGDDQLFANGGNDQTSGGAGNDTITLGLGDDRHDYRNGEDVDTITDFNAGAGSEDAIILTFHSAATSFVQMQMAGMFSQQGLNTQIDLGSGDMIILNNINVGDLHQDDFVF